MSESDKTAAELIDAVLEAADSAISPHERFGDAFAAWRAAGSPKARETVSTHAFERSADFSAMKAIGEARDAYKARWDAAVKRAEELDDAVDRFVEARRDLGVAKRAIHDAGERPELLRDLRDADEREDRAADVLRLLARAGGEKS